MRCNTLNVTVNWHFDKVLKLHKFSSKINFNFVTASLNAEKKKKKLENREYSLKLLNIIFSVSSENPTTRFTYFI